MKVTTYFKKAGSIYGVSEKFEFGEWTEEYDFRTRSLVSKTYAKRYL